MQEVKSIREIVYSYHRIPPAIPKEVNVHYDIISSMENEFPMDKNLLEKKL
jgi:hypothetical protein